MQDLRLNALALFLQTDVSDLEINSYNDQLIEHGSNEYLVVTDDEADELWDESLDNYLDEIIYPELPDSIKRYFDDEAWKNDARYDGRGHSLALYDGDENEITIYEHESNDSELSYTDNDTVHDGLSLMQNETFFIYRVN